MFDEAKIQALVDDLRDKTGEACTDIADEILVDILKLVVAAMLENRGHGLALIETVIQKLEVYDGMTQNEKDCKCINIWHGRCMNCGRSTQ